jgi:O-antigen/teichoic acid export membrane protein
MVQLRRSLLITFFSTNAMTAVQFGVTIVLARLLTPAEVGIFSLTAVVIGLAAVFRDFGVSNYLQREADLTPAKTAAALGLLLTTSWSLAACLYLARWSIAAWFKQPGIADVMQVLTISFMLLPFASFFYALLSRDLNAGKQAIVNAVGTAAYAATCLALAMRGHSYMSLAWANVANIAATIVVYLCLRTEEMALRPSLRGWRAPATFGAGAILGNLINHLYVALPELVLGKLSGAASVGLYSRANGLVGIFQQVAGPTVNYNALPFIAASYHARVPLGPILSKATSYLTGFALPAFAVTAVFAHDIILLLYGAQWLQAAPLVAILCASLALKIGYSLCTPSLTAIGRPYLSAIAPGAAMLARLVLILLSGARSLESLALALLVADLLTAPVPALLMARYLGYPVRQSVAAHLPSVALAALCLATAMLLQLVLPPAWHAMPRLLVLGLVMVPVWLAGVVLLRHPLRAELPALLGRLRPARPAPPQAR